LAWRSGLGRLRAGGLGAVGLARQALRHAYVVTSATVRFLTLHAPAGFEQFAAEAGQPAQALTLAPGTRRTAGPHRPRNQDRIAGR